MFRKNNFWDSKNTRYVCPTLYMFFMCVHLQTFRFIRNVVFKDSDSSVSLQGTFFLLKEYF